MADDFERALLITFDFTGGVDPALKERATSFINEVKSNPEVWRLCCERYGTSQYTEVRFWCLQTLHELLKTSYTAFPAGAKLEVKTAITTWLQGCADLKAGPAPFLRNKLAQALVAVLQFEFPSVWPSFFHDLVSALGAGEGLVDMFCRVLVAVDEDLVTLDIPRSQDESKLSMRIKDSMREHSISEVAEAWFKLLEAYSNKSPELSVQVLQTMQRYVSWIDISLIANPKFMPLLMSLLGARHLGLRAAAADCLTEVVSKRMDAGPKLQLVHSMGIVPLCAQWVNGFPGGADDEELLLKLARLLATLATEIIDSLKRLENSVISLAAVGLPVDDAAMLEVKQGSELGGKQMAALFPAIMAAFKSDIDEVALPLLPFMHAYVARLKVLTKRNQGLMDPQSTMHVRDILTGLAVCARFPRASACANGGAPGSPQELAAAREEQAEVEEKRRELFVLFKNISKIAFSEALSFVGAQLQSAIGENGSSATFQQVEVAVVMLYELGEGAPEEALKPDSGALGQLAVALMQATLPHARHRLVATAVLETFVRYSRVLQAHQHVIPSAVTAFLDGRGMGHAAEDVAARACYLFCRLVKSLRAQLRQHASTVLQSLQPHLVRIATVPIIDAGGAAAGRGDSGLTGTGAGANSRPPNAVVDDRLYVFEAVGLLLGQEEMPCEEQGNLLSSLLQPLREQIESNLSMRSVSSPSLVLQAMECVVRLNKGFKSDLVTRTRPQLGRMFTHFLEVAIQVPRAYPSNKLLRSRFISSVHRLVECLGPTLLPFLPAALEVLVLTQEDAADLTEVLVLTNQLLLKFKDAMLSLLQGLLPLLVAHLHRALGPDWDWTGKLASTAAAVSTVAAVAAASGGASLTGPSGAGTGGGQAGRPVAVLDEGREKGELQLAYYSLLHVVVHTGLSRALLELPPGALDVVINAVVEGAASHVDAGARRTCIQILERLITEWCSVPDDGAAAAGLGSPTGAQGPAPAGIPPPGAGASGAASSSGNGVSGLGGGGGGAEALPGFRSYAVTAVGGRACVGGLLAAGARGTFDVRDVAASALLGEAAVCLKLCYQRCGGDALLAHLSTALLPATGVPLELQQQLLYTIREGEAKDVKEALRASYAWLQQAAGAGQRR
ncbi:hypothetical protein FOA52_010389 [Chlamydomonas sp. UWO 241]|nr:hypothetical protein FOA52_010389 [Chlamydomonas sp. UWO 241]